MTDQQTFDTRIFWYAVLSAFGAGVCVGLLLAMWVY